MKHIFLNITLMLIFTFIQTTIFAQGNHIQTDTITVSGNCGECKSRIEDAAFVKGVKQAVWDKKTKILTVTYHTEKTTLDKIEISIAKAGHDTRNHSSSEKAYKRLPECCAYRTGVCHHE